MIAPRRRRRASGFESRRAEVLDHECRRDRDQDRERVDAHEHRRAQDDARDRARGRAAVVAALEEQPDAAEREELQRQLRVGVAREPRLQRGQDQQRGAEQRPSGADDLGAQRVEGEEPERAEERGQREQPAVAARRPAEREERGEERRGSWSAAGGSNTSNPAVFDVNGGVLSKGLGAIRGRSRCVRAMERPVLM